MMQRIGQAFLLVMLIPMHIIGAAWFLIILPLVLPMGLVDFADGKDDSRTNILLGCWRMLILIKE